MNKIFISYNSTDRSFAIELRDRLHHHGADVWIDISEMRAGDAIIRTLSKAISSTNYFVIILSPSSVNSRWVAEELEQALTRQVTGSGRFVIPLLYKKCQIPDHLRKLKYIDFTSKKRWGKALINY